VRIPRQNGTWVDDAIDLAEGAWNDCGRTTRWLYSLVTWGQRMFNVRYRIGWCVEFIGAMIPREAIVRSKARQKTVFLQVWNAVAILASGSHRQHKWFRSGFARAFKVSDSDRI
jgi:hypothetical protein